MTGRGSIARWLVLGPPLLWLGCFFAVPLAIVAKISLSEKAATRPPYRPVFEATLDGARWRAALDGLGLENFRRLTEDTLYFEAALTSIALAAGATILLGLIGFPLALGVARAPRAWRPLLLALIVIPFWTSFLIRVYAWIAILRPEGWLNAALLYVGLVREPLLILDTNAAVLIGLIYAYLPFMVLPVYASLDRLDPTLTEAAADLGATPLAAFWTVTFPLTRPGLAAGALLCFIPMIGEFVVPELLGGSDTLMLGRVLWSEFFANTNWPLAAAVAIAILLILLVPVVLLREVEARRVEATR